MEIIFQRAGGDLFRTRYWKTLRWCVVLFHPSTLGAVNPTLRGRVKVAVISGYQRGLRDCEPLASWFRADSSPTPHHHTPLLLSGAPLWLKTNAFYSLQHSFLVRLDDGSDAWTGKLGSKEIFDLSYDGNLHACECGGTVYYACNVYRKIHLKPHLIFSLTRCTR